MSNKSLGDGRTLTDRLDYAFAGCIQDMAEQGEYEAGTRLFLECTLGVELDGNRATNWRMGFKREVLEVTGGELPLPLNTSIRVAKILETPRGPTQFQDALRGVIIPEIIAEDDVNKLIVVPEAFLNAVILYLYDLFQKQEYEKAFRVVQYLNYFANQDVEDIVLWSLSNEEGGRFWQSGELQEDQVSNPYTHQDKIFSE